MATIPAREDKALRDVHGMAHRNLCIALGKLTHCFSDGRGFFGYEPVNPRTVALIAFDDCHTLLLVYSPNGGMAYTLTKSLRTDVSRDVAAMILVYLTNKSVEGLVARHDTRVVVFTNAVRLRQPLFGVH